MAITSHILYLRVVFMDNMGTQTHTATTPNPDRKVRHVDMDYLQSVSYC